LRDSEEELERNGQEMREVEREIGALREEIRRVEMERQDAKESMISMQDRYDCAAEGFRREQIERDDMQRRH
jgi:chromosome segregation ATPase